MLGVDVYNGTAGGDVAHTLPSEAGSGRAPHVGFAPTGHGEYGEDLPTLRASSGDCGGGSDGLVAGTLSGSGAGTARTGNGRSGADMLVGYVPEIVGQAMSAKWAKGSSGPAGDEAANLVAFKPGHFTRGKGGGPDDVTPPLSADADKGDQDAVVLAFDTTQVTHPESRSTPQPGDPTGSPSSNGHPPAIAFSCKDGGQDAGEDRAPTLRAMAERDSDPNGGGQVAVALHITQDPVTDEERSLALSRTSSGMGVGRGMVVRRLTPRECERLQGFPDDYTQVPYKGKPAADGPRYKALGNSMATPVMAWLGRRLAAVDAIPPRL